MSNFICSPILISGTTKDKLSILWNKTLSYHHCSVKCTWLPFPCHQNPLHNATWVKIHWNLTSSTVLCFTALCFPIAELPVPSMGLFKVSCSLTVKTSWVFYMSSRSRASLSTFYILAALFLDDSVCFWLTHNSYFLHMYKLYIYMNIIIKNLKIYKNLHWKNIESHLW